MPVDGEQEQSSMPSCLSKKVARFNTLKKLSKDSSSLGTKSLSCQKLCELKHANHSCESGERKIPSWGAFHVHIKKKNPLYPKFKNTMETNTLIFVSKIGQTHFKQALKYMVMEQKSLFWY